MDGLVCALATARTMCLGPRVLWAALLILPLLRQQQRAPDRVKALLNVQASIGPSMSWPCSYHLEFHRYFLDHYRGRRIGALVRARKLYSVDAPAEIATGFAPSFIY